MNTNKLFKVCELLWNEETRPATVAVHLCFLVVSSFAFFFFGLTASFIIDMESVSIGESSTDIMKMLIAWSNFFLNLLTMLIIVELGHLAASKYYRYRRDWL